MFAAVFLAMKTALGEQMAGTLKFSLSLPVSRTRLAWTKLAGGAATLCLPIILGAVVMTPLLLGGIIEQAPVRSPSDAAYVEMALRPSLSPGAAAELLWTTTAVAIAGGIQLLLILSIFGARRRSEAHIGFFGATLAFGWLVLMGVRTMSQTANWWLTALFPVSFITCFSYGGEGGSYTDLDIARAIWLRFRSTPFCSRFSPAGSSAGTARVLRFGNRAGGFGATGGPPSGRVFPSRCRTAPPRWSGSTCVNHCRSPSAG